jgi:hypothetical protein
MSPLSGEVEGEAEAEGDTVGEVEGYETGYEFDAVGYEPIFRVTWILLTITMSGA